MHVFAVVNTEFTLENPSFGMIMFDVHTMRFTIRFEIFLCFNHFVSSLVHYYVYICEVIMMIHKHTCIVVALVLDKARHLHNEFRNARYQCINKYKVTNLC